MPAAAESFKYDVFISYSRKDEAFADSLERALENYKPEKSLNVPQRNIEAFRDKNDARQGGHLDEVLLRHLAESAKLIVICTPNARKSIYVNREIRNFVALRGKDHIIPVLLSGVPNNDAKDGQQDEMAFPEELCTAIGTPLAVNFLNFDPQKDKVNKGIFSGPWYAILAETYGLSRSEMEQREKKRRARRRRLTFAGMAAALAVLSVMAVIMFILQLQARAAQALAETAQRETERALKDTEAARESERIQRLIAEEQKCEADIRREEAVQARDAAERATRAEKEANITAEKRRVEAEDSAKAERAAKDDAQKKRIEAEAATERSNRALRAADIENGRQEFLDGHPFNAAAYLNAAYQNPAGRQSAGHPATLRFLTGQSIKSLSAFRLAHDLPGTTSFDVSRDGKTLVTSNYIASDDSENYINILDIATGNSADQKQEDESCHTIKISPDDTKLLLTCGNQVMLKKFDGERLPLPPTGDDKITSAEFSGYGAKIIIAYASGAARVIDLEKQESADYQSGSSSLTAAKFSPDETKFVTVSDNAAWVWEIAAARDDKNPFPLSHIFKVNSAEFSHDGNLAVTAGWDRTAKIWNLSKEKKLWEKQSLPEPVVLMHGDENVVSAAFSPDDEKVLTACSDGTARVWGTYTGILHLTLNHSDKINSAKYSSDGSKIITASNDRTAKVWDAATGQLIQTIEDVDRIDSARFSQDGRTAFTLSAGSIKLWNVTGGPRTQIYQNTISAADFSPDGKHILSGSNYSNTKADKHGRVCATEIEDQCFALTGAGVVNSAMYSHDGKKIVTAGADSGVRVWSAENGAAPLFTLPHDPEILEINGRKSNQPVNVIHAKFSPADNLIATADDNYVLKVWNVDTRKNTLIRRFNGSIKSIAFIDEARLLVVAGFAVYLVNIKEQTVNPTENSRPDDRIYFGIDFVSYAEFSPAARKIVTANANNSVSVLDEQGEFLFNLDPKRFRSSDQLKAGFSPDGNKIVTAGSDGTAKIWDAATGKFLQSLQHTDAVNSAMFSPDGQLVVTAGKDKIAKIWDAETGKMLSLFRHGAAVVVAKFAKDNARLVTGTADGVVRVWDLSSNLPETNKMSEYLSGKNIFGDGPAPRR